MQLTIYRGSKEVGGNCIEVQSGTTRIILDVGMPLFDEQGQAHDGFSLGRMTSAELKANGIIPKVPGLFSGDSSPDAILLSHAHLDHVGLLRHTTPSIPVYASKGTSKMMLAGSVYANQQELPRDRSREIKPKQAVVIGDMVVTAFPVDHSIHGCLAFLIEADGKRILYTGDLRLHGRRQGEHTQIIQKFNGIKLDAIIVEGTHFGFDNGSEATEGELEAEIIEQVKAAPSLVLASFSPQNIDRLRSFIRAAREAGRTFVADAYTAFVLHLISFDAKLNNPLKTRSGRVYFPDSLKEKINQRGTNRANEISRDTEITMPEIMESPEKYVMVFRPSMLGDFNGRIPSKTLCLYSTWHGYSQRPYWQEVKKSLNEVQGKVIHVHTSGHALSSDLVKFTRAINAKTIIPIHSFEPEAFKDHFDNVTISTDGQTIQI
ncbi:Beta-lactamase superfamily domain protein [Rosistilla ulvae]|uniref:Beta-lactamase superfamily domain protein n=1 Tax=Rosistilla ulvae TaxID=1930277 RepID=A0A517M1L9_9BACT|nr:MBL fold metallo-hydrolase [Rosistilla ulvae]QDS88768.1 Beta-lactamase superfamily domain protein [Rosistilla ulvae]